MIKMDYKGKITNQEIPLFEGNNAYLRDYAVGYFVGQRGVDEA